MEELMEGIVFEKYPTYKDSGVEWLGEVPEHWNIVSLGSLLQLKSDKNHPEYDVLSVYREHGVIKKDSRDDNHNATSLDTSTYKALKPGDLVVNKMKAWQGSMGISPFKGIVSPAYITCEVTSKNIHSSFLHTLLRCNIYVGEYNRLSYGVRVGQWDMHFEDFKRIPLAIPTTSEQIAIANFLDKKTIQIDQAIAQKEKQIELLKERRQVLIHKAVTRGLNPDVKLKDSGVEWIGEIPEHWECVKMKFITQFILDGTHGSYPRVEYGYRLLSVRNIINDCFVYREDDSRVSERHFKEISSRFQVTQNDIQLAIVGATLGKVAIVEDMIEPFVTQRSVATIRVLENKCNSRFLFFYLKTGLFQSYLWLNAGFSAQPGVYLGTIKDSNVPLPCLLEQNEILSYLNNVTNKFKVAIASKEKEIEKLKEYKATLINSAVTGKIKVS